MINSTEDHRAREFGLTAIIPARGGSKRIPRKNIRPFLGKPLLARTIGILQSAGMFDHIVVSTDDSEVARVAIESGAEVPFLRAPGLADDHTATGPVIADAIDQLEACGYKIGDPVVAVYPAAVFTTAADLERSLKMFRSTQADMVFAGLRFSGPIQRAWRRSDDGMCEMIWPEHRLTRSQDLEDTYMDAGQFYIGSKSFWASDFAQNQELAMYVLPPWRSQDIDTLEDWSYAELLYTVLQDRAGRN